MKTNKEIYAEINHRYHVLYADIQNAIVRVARQKHLERFFIPLGVVKDRNGRYVEQVLFNENQCPVSYRVDGDTHEYEWSQMANNLSLDAKMIILWLMTA